MTSRLSDAVVAESADRLLAMHPHAYVSALDSVGFLRAMPTTVPLHAHQVFSGAASGSELVVPDDVALVVLGWEELRERGTAVAYVHLLAAPERPVEMHFFDIRERDGVLLGVLVGADDLALENRREGGLRARVLEMRVDQLGHILEVSPEAHLVLGWTAHQLIGTADLSYLHPDDVPVAVATWMSMLGEASSTRRTRLRFRHTDGHYVWLETTNSNLLDSAEHGCVVMERVDISDEVAAREALQASEQLLRTLAESLPLGIAQIDLQRRIVYRNKALSEILGQDGAQDFDAQVRGLAVTERNRVSSALETVLERGESACLEVTVDRLGAQRQVEVRLQALTSSDGTVAGSVVCVTDVTAPVRMREELRRQATYDDLTGCHNRASILAVLEEALASAASDSGTAAVFLDLDQFKHINDAYGHATGDDVLRAVAAHLLRLARAADVLGRMGGDEFVLVCRDVNDADTAERIRQRIIGSLPVIATSGERPLAATFSVGVSWTTGGSGDAEDLIAAADASMYRAKRHRRAEPATAPRP